MNPPRVAFLGTPEVAVPALQRLTEQVAVDAVFTNPDQPFGRGRILTPPPVRTAAEALGRRVHQPSSWKAPETRTLWESLDIDLAVVVAYGHLLPHWMLDSCRLGVWNLHYSLLPRWRGAAPVNHALWAGDAETGVSLMRITPGLDAGPVLAQVSRPILPSDTAESLLEALAGDAAALLVRHLPELLAGTAAPVPQDETRVTLAPKLAKAMAGLDPAQPASALHRQIRALQPWPGAELRVGADTLRVAEVGGLRALTQRPGSLTWNKAGAWLCAGDGQSLELLKLQRPGKAVQPALQALQPWGRQGELLLS